SGVAEQRVEGHPGGEADGERPAAEPAHQAIVPAVSGSCAAGRPRTIGGAWLGRLADVLVAVGGAGWRP
ncbi:MAG TPA: hypothetical protein VJ370_14920, partial [Streptosporangiaceae bacterium]|nr:hypothetical protein [Streptosporangiaceae bacterium]